MTKNEKLVIDFLKMLEHRQSPEALNNFYHPEIEQTEFPNAVTKNTSTKKLNDLKEASEKGRKILSREQYGN